MSQAEFWAKEQNWTKATDYTIKALDDAEKTGDKQLKARALTRLSSIDIMTWRDAQAWEHACQAESAARETGIDSLIADALLCKGKICAYGNIDGSNPRDEEGLAYFREALGHCAGSPSREMDLHYNISQLYVNMNRFNNPLDEELYRKAGEELQRGDSIGRAAGLTDYESRAHPYRMRYLRQGGRTDEGIESCLSVLEGIGDNYLMKSQVYDHLVALYAQKGDIVMSAEAHQQCVNALQFFIKQKSDEMLQEMESRYEANLLKTRISGYRTAVIALSLVLLLLVSGTIFILSLHHRLSVRKQKLAEANELKGQLLRLISKQFSDPSSYTILSDAVRSMADMDDNGIRSHCNALFKDNPAMAEELGEYFVNLRQSRLEKIKELGLSAREMEIMRCCREGLSNKQMAERLFISENTIKNHKQNIFSKLGVQSTTEMLSKMDEAGLP